MSYPTSEPTYPTGAPAAAGGDVVVEPPTSAPSSELVAVGGSPVAWTATGWTGDTGSIASYQSSLEQVNGSGTLTGTAPGPLNITGAAAGDSYTARVDALDSSGNVLASQCHTWTFAASVPAWATLVSQDMTTATEVDIDTGGDGSYNLGSCTFVATGTGNTSTWNTSADGMEVSANSNGDIVGAVGNASFTGHASWSDWRNATILEMHLEFPGFDAQSTSLYAGLVIGSSTTDWTTDGGAMFQVYKSAAGTLTGRIFASITGAAAGSIDSSPTLGTGLSGTQHVALRITQRAGQQLFHYQVSSTAMAFSDDDIDDAGSGWSFAYVKNRQSNGTSLPTMPQGSGADLYLLLRAVAVGSTGTFRVTRARARHYNDTGVE